MTFDRFDVALTRFPFTEKRGQKVRPVAVLSDRTFHEAHNHLIGAMITTAANTRWPSDVAIVSYREAGLRTPCVVRLKLFTLQLDLVHGRLGSLADPDRQPIRRAVERAICPK
ncbi:type II toxin-antitoxin system PemK/MazF family toxin [Roseitalea porphyridii]|uniref:type II toxin-antitoxin system PemK/MazF family toxin n=1 Tax=Roseitalea porphyridii TaxID=1852022 RepID=UPI0013158330|nr:type II toxin-antitoxin system PemK/MazF family toxin [Roseitalea porphyridii]